MLTAKVLTILREHTQPMKPFLSGMGRPMISLPNADAPGTLMHIDVKSGAFRNWFRDRVLLSSGMVLSDEAVKTAASMLSDRAESGGVKETGVRIIRRADRAWLDLARGDGKVIEIDADGWREVLCPPDVRFIPNPCAAPLPSPLGGYNNISQLRDFVNVSDEEDFALIVAWLMGCFMAHEMPMLVMNGQQNSGKSTNSHVIRQMIDPSRQVDLLVKPRSERDLVSDVANRFVMVYDNISKIDEWLSNIFCCLSTGGTFGGRALYSDYGSTRFTAVRPMILNGIPEFVGYDDLKRRMFHIQVPTMRDKQRDKTSIYSEFEEQHPKMLGSLLDAVVVAFQNRKTAGAVTNKTLPLRDPIIWANSASEALGFKKNFILEVASVGAIRDLAESFNNSPLAQAVLSFMSDKPEWVGTSKDLLKSLVLDKPIGAKDIFWPDSPKGLTTMLQKAGPALMQEGLAISRFKKRGGWFMKLVMTEPEAFESPSTDAVTLRALRDSKREEAA